MNIIDGKANKRWGRGRLLQEAIRARCRVKGHDWGRWHYDWPEDEPGHPGAGDLLLWIRTCRRDCGCHQTAKACLAEAHQLPGGTGGWICEPTYGRSLPQ